MRIIYFFFASYNSFENHLNNFSEFFPLILELYTSRVVPDCAAEPRFASPASPPNLLSVKQNHVPSLSPINSSTETTPTNDSPPMKFKSSSNDFLRGSKAKSIISSILNNKATNKRFVTQISSLGKATRLIL